MEHDLGAGSPEAGHGLIGVGDVREDGICKGDADCEKAVEAHEVLSDVVYDDDDGPVVVAD
jgi:hypothetical protein